MDFAPRHLKFCAALTLFSAAASLTAANGHEKQKTITVTEGTDMAVTVSPDHKTILADIQGLIYAILFTGGAGKQLTTPMQEASHPDWSANSGLVALQCYAGGTVSPARCEFITACRSVTVTIFRGRRRMDVQVTLGEVKEQRGRLT